MRSPNVIRFLLVGALCSIGLSRFDSASRLMCAQNLEEETTAARPRGETFRGTANLEPVSRLDLRCETGQSVAVKWVAPEGKVVKKGTLLVELDASPLLEKLEEQRVTVEKTKAQLAVAERSLAQATDESGALLQVAEQGLVVADGALKAFVSEGGEFQLEVAAVEGKIAVAEKRLEVVTARLRRGTGDEDAQLALVEAQAQLETAKARHRYLTGQFRDQRIAELKLAVAQRKLDLIRARSQSSHAGASHEAAVVATQADLKLELGKLERLERRVAACKIYAPQAGTVVYPQLPRRRGPADVRREAARRSRIQRGAMVRADQVLLCLVDQTRFKLEVGVSLQIAQRVVTGQPVAIEVDAFPQRTIRGHVTRVRVAEGPSRSVEGVITVRLEDATGQLKTGMSTVVEIELSEKAPRKK